jgi:hypothetical protein
LNPPDPLAEPVSREMQAIAGTLGDKLHVIRATNEQELTAAFESLGH